MEDRILLYKKLLAIKPFFQRSSVTPGVSGGKQASHTYGEAVLVQRNGIWVEQTSVAGGSAKKNSTLAPSASLWLLEDRDWQAPESWVETTDPQDQR